VFVKKEDVIVLRALVESLAIFPSARPNARTTGIATPRGNVSAQRVGEDLFVKNATFTMGSF
jgi:hypothetical protein